MAAPANKPASPPPLPPAPPSPPPAPEKRDQKALAATFGSKSKFDPLRPFRYAKEFVNGTVGDTLDKMSSWGRKGVLLGIGAAIIGGFGATLGLGAVVGGAAAGLAAGALLGAGVGLLTGGLRGMARQERAEKYKDDLIVRTNEKQPGAAVTGIDYREAHRQYQDQQTYILDRVQQVEREQRAESHYWRDRVNESHGHGGQGHGHGGGW